MKINLRRSLKITLLVCIFIGSIPLTAWWLINDEPASRWLLQQVFMLFSQQISVTAIHGRLRDGIELENITFQSESKNIQVKHALIRWQSAKLAVGLWKINEVKLDGMTLVMLKSAEESTFDPLAKIDLPLNIELDNFLLSDLKVKQDKNNYQIDKLQFSAATQENQLLLRSLTIAGQGVTATVKGQTKLGEGFPFHANLAWQFSSPAQGHWRGVVTATGNSNSVNFNHQLLLPFVLQQQVRVEHLMSEPLVTVSSQWKNLRWPLTGDAVQISSTLGDLKISGSLQNYQIQLQGQLKQTQTRQAQLQFTGHGTDQGLHIAQLNLRSKFGILQLTGNVDWQKALKFDLQAKGEHFNPAIVQPELTGDLNFKTRLTGQILAEKLQLAVDITGLTGKLNNYPLTGQGQLALLNEQVDIKLITLASGVNKLTVTGLLAQKNASLDLALSAPQLRSLSPSFAGQLHAKAHLAGDPAQPTVQLQAAGKQLHFQQYAVKNLAMTINYAADNKKKSQLQLTATDLSSGATQIAKLLVSGQGLKQQHNFTVQANSEQGDLNLALSGSLQGNNWQARLSELDIKQPQAGRWLLKKPALLTVNKRAAGVDLALTETCFSQIAAFVCLQGNYPANGYFQGVIHSLLPSELAKPYLPKDLNLAGQLNVDGNVAKNHAGLSGNYHLSLSKNSTLTVKVDQQLTSIPLNSLLLSGTLQGTRINSDLNLLFGGKNYLRGQLNLDTGTTQAISGQFSAAIMDFTPLLPYILPLSELKGNLTAAVTVAGTLTKPALLGNVSLNNAAVSAESAGIRIEDIAVKLYTLAAAPERVVITGTAKSGSGRISLNGNVQLKPALGYPAELLISGNEFEVVKLPQALISISPELSCKYANNVGAITGKLTVAKAQIKLAELPSNAAVPSEDEQIMGEQPVKPALPAAKIGVNIAIDLGKLTHFTGLGLDTDLLGSLRLSKKAENLVLFGTVDMQNGRYKSYGQELTVRRGRFVFNGSSSNPQLDIEAIRLSKSKKVTAILKLTGALQNPQTQISSEPSLPESDALAYLVTGRALNQVTKSDGNMLASAALSYGAGKVAWIAEKFGIDEFELQEGESIKDSLLAVGQYLTPDFYVGAKVGLFSKQTALILKYKITEHLSISTQSGESQRVYLNYEFSHK